MLWFIQQTDINFICVRIICITTDEKAGELTIRADFDGLWEIDIIYEGMYYSQFDESSCGILVNNVTSLTIEELKQDKYINAVDRLYKDCQLGEQFFLIMQKRSNRFFVHHTNNGIFIVLAKRLCFGERVYKLLKSNNRK